LEGRLFVLDTFHNIWARGWMRFAGLSRPGRLAMCFSGWGMPPFYGRIPLSRMGRMGFVSPRATIYHPDLRIQGRVLLDDGVVIYGDRPSTVTLGDDVHLWRESIIQTGLGGSVSIGAGTHIQTRCQLSGYVQEIRIGRGVEIAPYCAFYPYDHGMDPAKPVGHQPLTSKGPIVVGDYAWLGTGVIVLSGVNIGPGAVIAAGSVVTRDIPENAIATGSPARVVKFRHELKPQAAHPGP
jgi:acetyltransferase-like isoleucine patch superfamily enzyme